MEDIILIMGDIILSIVVTIGIYTFPIAIYRYAIRCESVEKKKAGIITIAYAVFSFILMSLIKLFIFNSDKGAGSSAILIWSSVNYFMLTSGSKNKFSDKDMEYDSSKKPKVITEKQQKPIAEEKPMGVNKDNTEYQSDKSIKIEKSYKANDEDNISKKMSFLKTIIIPIVRALLQRRLLKSM